MIESITIADVASFGSDPQVLDGLAQFNYIFGANATGKTTISRIIADESRFPSCKVMWRGGTRLQPKVYNQDFIEHNFNQSTELKGVFTLGEHRIEILNRIATLKDEIDGLTTRIESLTRTLQGDDGQGGKHAELAALEEDFKKKCWAQKQRHDGKLHGAFEGYRNNSEKFKGKVLTEQSRNTASLVPLSELERKAETVFGPPPAMEPSIPAVDMTALLNHQANPILKKKVIGKDDVDIAAMIKRLGNSDWVREGRPFYDANNSICPFCQQKTPDSFAKSLEGYFDESFVTDSKAISDLADCYAADAVRIQKQLASIIEAPSRFIDLDKLKTEKKLLDSRIIINNQRIASKKKESSQVIELESHDNVVAAITSLIDSANARIVEHNRIVANITAERTALTAQVWRFVLEELKTDLTAYSTAKDGLVKAIKALNTQIEAAKADKEKKAKEIRELEKQTTSVQPTVDAINSLLRSFGFHGFSLAKVASGRSYRLIRPDGVDAKATLSEGEKSFVTFLYFYHLLKGSESESGITTDRVVVFDDPVSSFDSDILFIVGSLIKGLFDEVRADKGHIKQIFVLTHNVYFHKEVTFNPRRCDRAMNEETFWIVRRPGKVSMLERHPSNPIKTSYELLWSEVRNPNRSKLTIQNTLRRILENYFKILGGIDLDDLCAMFEGREKLICKSLCSWVHDGSHYAYDDFYVAIDDAMVDSYLRVFREIFEKSGQIAHYRMMMGDTIEEAAREFDEESGFGSSKALIAAADERMEE